MKLPDESGYKLMIGAFSLFVVIIGLFLFVGVIKFIIECPLAVLQILFWLVVAYFLGDYLVRKKHF